MTQLIRRSPSFTRLSPFDFEDFWSGWPSLTARGQESFTPRLNIYEKDSQFCVDAELPGLDKDDVEVKVEEDTLVLSGERKSEEESDDDGFFRREFSYGSFMRSVPLSFKPDPKKVKAQFHDGVLEIRLPIPEAKKKAVATKIAIK